MSCDELLNKTTSALSSWNEWNAELQPVHYVSHTKETENLCELLDLSKNPNRLKQIYCISNETSSQSTTTTTTVDSSPPENMKIYRKPIGKIIKIKGKNQDIRQCMTFAGKKKKQQQPHNKQLIIDPEIVDLTNDFNTNLTENHKIVKNQSLTNLNKVLKLNPEEMKKIESSENQLRLPNNYHDQLQKILDKYLKLVLENSSSSINYTNCIPAAQIANIGMIIDRLNDNVNLFVMEGSRKEKTATNNTPSNTSIQNTLEEIYDLMAQTPSAPKQQQTIDKINNNREDIWEATSTTPDTCKTKSTSDKVNHLSRRAHSTPIVSIKSPVKKSYQQLSVNDDVEEVAADEEGVWNISDLFDDDVLEEINKKDVNSTLKLDIKTADQLVKNNYNNNQLIELSQRNKTISAEKQNELSNDTQIIDIDELFGDDDDECDNDNVDVVNTQHNCDKLNEIIICDNFNNNIICDKNNLDKTKNFLINKNNESSPKVDKTLKTTPPKSIIKRTTINNSQTKKKINKTSSNKKKFNFKLFKNKQSTMDGNSETKKKTKRLNRRLVDSFDCSSKTNDNEIVKHNKVVPIQIIDISKSNDDDDDVFVTKRSENTKKLNEENYNKSATLSSIKKISSKKKKIKKKLKENHGFIETEANVSFGTNTLSTDDSDNSSLDEMDESFINDCSHDSNETFAAYLRSVKSPRGAVNKYKIPDPVKYNDIDVYSQQIKDTSINEYINDSFCVNTSHESSIDSDISILEIADKVLAIKEDVRKKKKKKKRKRIILNSSSESDKNDQEDNEKKPLKKSRPLTIQIFV